MEESDSKKHSKTKNLIAGVIVLGCIGAVCAALVLTLAPSAEKSFPYISSSRLGKYRTAAVSCDAAPCSEVGRNVLKDGGNAVDAAIATLFCVGAVNPQSAGIGGGFLMTVYDPKERKARCLDAREVAPLAATENMFMGKSELAQKGGLGVAVPGELAGYWTAHQAYGRLPWSRLLQPTITMVEKGVPVNRHLATIMTRFADLIEGDPSFLDFMNQTTKRVKKEGEIVKRPTFAKTLKTIAEHGVQVFYNGSIGKKMVQDVRKKGGIISERDLLAYRPKWVDPISANLGSEFTLYSIPPPGSGALVAYILNMLMDTFPAKKDRVGGKHKGFTDPLIYHRVIEAFKFAFAKRTKLADPAFVPEVNELMRELTSKKAARDARKLINDSYTFNDPKYYGADDSSLIEDHGTSHVSVLDKDGMAVSVSSTINVYFGAKVISDQTGIILNNEMDDFTSPGFASDSNVPPNNRANLIRPGKRPVSSMVPSIIVRSDAGTVRLIVGGTGGTQITTSVSSVIIRNLWYGQNIKEAIDSSRIHHQLYPMAFIYESAFPQEIIDMLKKKGHKTDGPRASSVVIGVAVEDDGYIYANSDFRKGGDVAGIDPA